MSTLTEDQDAGQVSPSETHGPSRLGSIYRRILTGTGIYSIAVLAQRLASVLMLPLFTRYLTPAEYGTLEILDLSLNVFGMLFGVNFASALFYHFFNAESEEHRNTVVSTTLLGSTLLGFTGAGVGFILSERLSMFIFQSPAYSVWLRIMLLNFAFTLPLEATLYWLRAIDRSRTFVIATLIRLGMAVALTATSLVILKTGVQGVLWSNLITSSVLSLALGGYCLWKTSWHMNLHIFRRLLRYSVPVTLTGAALFTMHYVDRFILQRYVSLAEIGIYSLAYKIGMMISNMQSPFQTYWTSQMYELASGPQGQKLLGRLFTYFFLFLATGAVVLIAFTGPGLKLMATAGYAGAASLVPWIVAAYVTRGVGDYFRAVFYTENKPVYDTQLNWIGAAVCVIAYFALIPTWKVWGAVGATFLAFASVAIIGYKWAHSLRGFSLEWWRLSTIAIGAMIPMVCAHFLPSLPLAAEIGANAILMLLFPALLWVLRFATQPELDLLRNLRGRAMRLAGVTLSA